MIDVISFFDANTAIIHRLAKEDFDHALKVYEKCKYDATEGAVIKVRDSMQNLLDFCDLLVLACCLLLLQSVL